MPKIETQQWIMAGIAFAFSAYLLVSAIWFPNLRATWGLGKPGIPMSSRGKTAMGVCVGVFGAAILFGNTKAEPALLVVWAVIMIAIIPVWWRDYRDSENV